MANLEKLVSVFEEARRLILLPENDFSWSGWEDAADALEEIAPVLESLRKGIKPSVSLYFLPTGPLQELSLSSGWGDAFIELANRFDAAMSEPCQCLSVPLGTVPESRALGMDKHFSEVSLKTCPGCGRTWLHYLHENEAFSGSGRWFLGLIENASITAEEAKATLEGLAWYYHGGSYFEGRTGRTSGPIPL